MAKMFRTFIDRARAIADQQDWIEDHGGDVHGYVLNYGSVNDADHYGLGGEAIYAADIEALNLIIRTPVREKPPKLDFACDYLRLDERY